MNLMRIRRRITLIALASSFVMFNLCGSAEASDSDSVGLYFDTQGLVSEATTTTPWETVIGYLVLKNLSAPTGLLGIAVRGRIEGATACWHSLIGSQNGTCDMTWYVGSGTPIPPQPVHTVIRVFFNVESPTVEVRFYLEPTPLYEHTVYVSPDDPTLHRLYPNSAGYSEPVAVVNRQAVAVDSASWGAVKALYR